MEHGVNRRRVMAVLMSVFFVVAATVAPYRLAPVSSGASSAVTWTVDHSSKVITVTVKLTFTGLNLRGEVLESPSDIVSFQNRVTAIEDAIRRVWDGQHFKCYKMKVVITSRVLASSSGTAGDESPITLLHTRTPSIRRAFFGTRNSDPLSEDPSDAYEATTGSINGTSVWPLMSADSVYGRLFGRILGLDSTYDPVSGQAVLGAANDVMSGGSGKVSPETMTRLIRRSTLRQSELTCPLTADLIKGPYIVTFFAVAQFGAHAWICDYDPPSSLPAPGKIVTFTGSLDVSGDWATLIGSGSVSGPAPVTATWDPREPMIDFRSGGFVMRQGVGWTSMGLVPVGNVLLVGGSPPLATTGRFSFTNGAPECK